MPRSPTVNKKKTAAQQALIAFRRRLGLSQQAFAARLNVAPVTVARWESGRTPTGWSAARLANFARQVGDPEAEASFLEATEIIEVWQQQEAATAAEHRRLFKPKSAAGWVLEQIEFGAKLAPALLAEYRKTVERLLENQQALLYHMIGATEDLTELAAAHKALRKELERLDERLKETEAQAKR